MKTLKILNTAILTFSAVLMFTITSCEKDESPAVSGTSGTDNAMSASAVNALTKISIDHNSVQTNAPDYSLTVYTNGEVVFYGRRNTFVKGYSRYNLTPENYTSLIQYLNENNLTGIQPGMINKYQPVIRVSYKENESLPTWTNSANENNTNELSVFTHNLESKLNVSELIGRGSPVLADPNPSVHTELYLK